MQNERGPSGSGRKLFDRTDGRVHAAAVEPGHVWKGDSLPAQRNNHYGRWTWRGNYITTKKVYQYCQQRKKFE